MEATRRDSLGARILKGMLAVILVVGLSPYQFQYAWGNDEGNTHYLAFASDRHASTSAIGDAMSGFSGSTEYVGLIGDMVNKTSSYNTSTVVGEVQEVFPELSTSAIDIVWGSHDENATDDAGVMNGATAGSSGVIYAGADSDEDGNPDYYVYGIAYYDMSEYSNAQTAADNFKTWVDGISDKSIPIFVVCHMPMHAQRGDNNGGYAWSEALNYAATNAVDGETETPIVRDIVFLHGHNHTTESNAEFYYVPGSSVTMEDNGTDVSTTIRYTYLTAGYLNANSHATQVTLTDNTISFNRGGAALGSVTRVNGEVEPSIFLDKFTLSLTEGKEAVLTATTAGITDPVVSWESSNESVATVEDGTVTAVSVGTAEVTATATGTDSSGARVTKSAKCAVAVAAAPEGVTYKLASSIESGKSYLVVSGGHALSNDSGTLGADEIDGTAGDETVSMEEAGDLWTATENSSFSAYGSYTLANDGYWLARSSGSGSKALGAEGSSTDLTKYGVWNYSSGALTQLGGNSSSSLSTFYAYYSSDKAAFYTSTTAAEAYLYEPEGAEVEPSISLDKSTLSLTEGKTASLTATTAGIADPVVSWESSNESVATVEDGAVTAVSVGTAEVTATATGTDSSGAPVTKSAKCAVAVRAASEGVTYKLASSIESGKSYLVVSGGHALSNDSGTLGADEIDGTAGDETVSMEEAGDLWTATENSSFSAYGSYTLANGGYWLARSSGSGSKALGAEGSSTDLTQYGVWSYSSGALTQIGGSKSTSTYYAYYSSDEGAFYTSTTAAEAYLYEPEEASVAKRGDANGNGAINIVDAQIVLDLSNGVYGDSYEKFPYPEEWGETQELRLKCLKIAADANVDSVITALDARAIQYYVHHEAWED